MCVVAIMSMLLFGVDAGVARVVVPVVVVAGVYVCANYL